MVTRKEKLHSVKMYFQCNLILLRQYDRLLHFTINIKKSHRQLQWTLQPVCEDRVLFVWVDLHISLYRQQHQNAVVCIHMNFLLTMTDTITSLSFWITMYIYIYIYIVAPYILWFIFYTYSTADNEDVKSHTIRGNGSGGWSPASCHGRLGSI